jgi:hypothetical protein
LKTSFNAQVRDKEYALDPFEILAPDHVKGSVLDLGCGLGNLSPEAGRRGQRVVAVDASPPPSHDSTKTLSVKAFRCEAFRRTSRVGTSTRGSCVCSSPCPGEKGNADERGYAMKSEGMQGGGMMMGKMKEMQGKMGEMKKGMGGMMKGQGMMKCEDMKGMGNVSG